MSVKVADKKTGKETTGKYAIIKGGQVSLYTGIMSDKKGGWARLRQAPCLPGRQRDCCC